MSITLTDAPLITEAETRVAVATQRQLIWWRFRKHKLAVVSAVIVLLFYVVAAFADVIAYSEPFDSQAARSYIPPQPIHWFDADGHFHPQVYALKGKRDLRTFKLSYAPDPSDRRDLALFAHGYPYRLFGLFPTDIHLFGVSNGNATDALFLFGTDQLGRDVFSRLVLATRTSLTIGLVSVALSLVLGVLLGGISGLHGGWIDTVIQRVIEILRSIPVIPLWMGLAAAIPTSWSPEQVYFAITIIISLIGWTELARVVRGRFLALREEDFIVAAELAGASRLRIIFKHMVPSFLSHIIAATSLALPAMIISETTLSFLGLGLRPPAISWGVMLQDAQSLETLGLAPWLLIAAVPVIIVILAFNFLGDGLRDAAIHMVDPILSVRDLKTYFLADEGAVRAVDGTSFDLFPGQTLGIVGESGCGKSVTARSILRIVERPGRIIGGEIMLRRADGSVADLTKLPPDGAQMRAIRGGEIGLVFQEPMSSLSAFHTIGNQLIEAIRLHAPLSKRAARARAIELLAMVGIPRPSQRIDAYSFELSGGLRQRVMIALALAAEPRILIADEPTTALDVTTQAQILELIRSLQQQRGLAVILITHDMGVIAEMADHVVVMYLGHEVEKGPIDAIFHAPAHPYTRALLRSIPSVLAEPRSRLATIAGSIPHPFARPPGCPFHPRCPEFMRGTCDKSFPAEVAIAESHAAACHLYAPEHTQVPA